MKDTTLPTLSEVVDITADMAYDGNFITNHIWDYNDFLKQPLKLEMFIPCNDKGEPLEEPKDFKVFLEWQKDRDVFSKAYLKEFDKYQQAKDRTFIKWNGTKEQLDIILRDNKTIGDLCGRIELTESKYKELCL